MSSNIFDEDSDDEDDLFIGTEEKETEDTIDENYDIIANVDIRKDTSKSLEPTLGGLIC